MLRAVVLVKEEYWQFHNPEVDDQVPKDDRVFGHEYLLGQHGVALL